MDEVDAERLVCVFENHVKMREDADADLRGGVLEVFLCEGKELFFCDLWAEHFDELVEGVSESSFDIWLVEFSKFVVQVFHLSPVLFPIDKENAREVIGALIEKFFSFV